MSRRALVALELSPAAESLLSELRWLPRIGIHEAVLAHVLQPDGPDRELAHARLRALATRLRQEGLEVRQKVGEGDRAGEIVRLAREEAVDVIVVGSRSRREGWEARTALSVFQRAGRPVLLLRTPEALLEAPFVDPLGPDAPAPPPPERILLATDLSPAVEGAVQRVEALVEGGWRRVDLLHALGNGDASRETAERRLDELAERLAAAGATAVHRRVEPGEPPRVIRALAREAPRPLVVMGAQGKGFVKRTLVGSVSREVAREIEEPLLLVPPAG